jgi:hypothetical protein
MHLDFSGICFSMLLTQLDVNVVVLSQNDPSHRNSILLFVKSLVLVKKD